MTRRGLTLTEVLITVAVIAILAAIALPQFQRTTERSYWRSARDILETIYAGEQVYFLKENHYLAFDAADATNWTPIFMDNPNPGPLPVAFTVGVLPAPPAAATTFIATATRDGGPCDDRTLTINHSRVQGGDWLGTGLCP